MNLPQVLMYHYVRDVAAGTSPGYRALDLATFEAQLDDVCRHRTPISWPQLRDALATGGDLPADAVLLTFDDGLSDHHRHVLPRLVARGIGGTFFVLARRPSDGLALGHRLHVLIGALGSAAVRDAVVARLAPSARERFETLEAARLALRPDDPEDAWKRPLQRELTDAVQPILGRLIADRVGPEDEIATELYLGDAQLRDLCAEGMDLGGHGIEHPWMDALDRDRLRAELGGSAAWLSRFAPLPWPFAYPYGGVPRQPGPPLARSGFCAAFTTDDRDRRPPFRIGRFDADDLGPAPSRAMQGR